MSAFTLGADIIVGKPQVRFVPGTDITKAKATVFHMSGWKPSLAGSATRLSRSSEVSVAAAYPTLT